MKFINKKTIIIFGIFVICISILAGLRATRADPTRPVIVHFERGNPVFNKSVEFGTLWEDLDLPAKLRAVYINGQSSAHGATPTDLPATPSNLNLGFPQIADVSVTWEGDYDGDTPGTYVLTAKIENYIYNGEMPKGIIIVKQEEIKEEPTEKPTEEPKKEEPKEPDDPKDPEEPDDPDEPDEPEEEEEEEEEYINTFLRDEIVPRANYSLADLAIVKRTDLITGVDGLNWRVIRSKVLDNGVTYYLLVTSTTHHHNSGSQSHFGTNSNYNGSLLQGRMTEHYKLYPTIQAIAVVPILGDHTNITVTSEPTAEMALGSGKTVDIMFALSRQDYINWNNGRTDPLSAPLNDSSYGQRSWSRTSRTPAELYGIINASGATYKGIDAGLMYNGTVIGEIPAVWINGDAVWRDITVYYVDTDGKSIGPVSKPYPVLAGQTLTLYDPEDIPEIGGYEYKEYTKGAFGNISEGNVFKNPTLTKAEVLADTDIYLIYERTVYDTSLKITKTLRNETNPEKEFTFKVILADTPANPLKSGQTFEYEGGIIDNSGAVALPAGSLPVDGNIMTFNLKHGQTITIKEIPPGYDVLIYELPDAQYNTWSIKDGTEKEGTFADMVHIILNSDVTVDFVNKRIYVPPTGISDESPGMGWLLVLAPALLTGLALPEIIKRRRKQKN